MRSLTTSVWDIYYKQSKKNNKNFADALTPYVYETHIPYFMKKD